MILGTRPDTELRVITTEADMEPQHLDMLDAKPQCLTSTSL